jgi:hypothetical protein
MTGLKELFTDSRYDKILFAIVCAIMVWLQLRFGLQHFYYDAERYWEGARWFEESGTIKLEDYIEKRGVLFPLINYLIIKFAAFFDLNEINLFKSMNAVLTCWGVWYVLPSVHEHATGGRRLNSLSRLGLVALVNFFWFRGFSVPLTDFMCLFLFLQGFCLVWKERPSFFNIMIAGFICGYVFNTRPIYNVLLIVFPLFIWVVTSEKPIWKSIKIGVFLAASFLICLPQYILNQRLWKVSTFLQPTETFYEGQSLYLLQLKWGLVIQKYETYTGDSVCYKNAQVFFFHKGEKQRNIQVDSILTFDDYFRYMANHPSAVIKYAHNLFNGLDVQYNSVYVMDMKTNWWFALLNYAVLFAGIGLLLLCRRRLFSSHGFLIIFAYLFVTVALCVPTAIEVRFMVPVYFLLYLMIAAEWATGITWIRSRSLPQLLLLAGVWILFTAGCFYLSSLAYAGLEHKILC